MEYMLVGNKRGNEQPHLILFKTFATFKNYTPKTERFKYKFQLHYIKLSCHLIISLGWYLKLVKNQRFLSTPETLYEFLSVPHIPHIIGGKNA